MIICTDLVNPNLCYLYLGPLYICCLFFCHKLNWYGIRTVKVGFTSPNVNTSSDLRFSSFLNFFSGLK